MPLLCELGWHRADPLARWNNGYYFSKCRRCGSDLVRTAFAGWQVPEGFKVVWQAKPPASTQDVQLVPEQAAAVAGPAAVPPAPSRPAADEGRVQAPALPVAAHGPVGEPTSSEAATETEQTGAQMPLPEAEADEEAHHQPAPTEAELPFDAPEPIEEPAAEDSIAITGTRGPELPIQEVLRQLGEGIPESKGEGEGESKSERTEAEGQEAEARESVDPVEETPPADPPVAADPTSAIEPPPAVEPAPAVRAPARRGAIPDFMNDDPGEDLLESMNEPPRNDPPPIPEDPALPDGRNARDELDAAFASGGSAAAAPAPYSRHKILGERDSGQAKRSGEGDPGDNSARARAAVTIAASFGVVMLAAALMARPGIDSGQAGDQSAVGAEGSPTSPPQTAAEKEAEAEAKRFVTASLLNCRSSPDEESKPVRRLRRGDTVRVLAMEPSWASVSHKGRQCWASTRYISQYKPL